MNLTDLLTQQRHSRPKHTRTFLRQSSLIMRLQETMRGGSDNIIDKRGDSAIPTVGTTQITLNTALLLSYGGGGGRKKQKGDLFDIKGHRGVSVETGHRWNVIFFRGLLSQNIDFFCKKLHVLVLFMSLVCCTGQNQHLIHIFLLLKIFSTNNSYLCDQYEK